ncbi:hypothetical protein DVW02_04180 [Clostridium botulinum]|nr:hypothetical protein [Clostridium botulinum]
MIVNVGFILNENHIPFKNGTIIETDIDIEKIANNYKLVDEQLIELTTEEKEHLFFKPKEPTKEELLQKQLLETQNLVLELQYKLINKDLDIK